MTMPTEPLTDVEMDALIRRAEFADRWIATAPKVLDAIAQLRRLRADDWVLAAAEEIDAATAQFMDGTSEVDGPADIAKIIRKHRDGA